MKFKPRDSLIMLPPLGGGEAAAGATAEIRDAILRQGVGNTRVHLLGLMDAASHERLVGMACSQVRGAEIGRQRNDGSSGSARPSDVPVRQRGSSTRPTLTVLPPQGEETSPSIQMEARRLRGWPPEWSEYSRVIDVRVPPLWGRRLACVPFLGLPYQSTADWGA